MYVTHLISKALCPVCMAQIRILRHMNRVATVCMRGSRKFCQRGSDFDNVFLFLVDEGSKEYIEMRGGRIQIHCKRAIMGPPAKHHLNGVSLAFSGDPVQY